MSRTNVQMKPLTMMACFAAALSFLAPAHGQVIVGPWEIHEGGGPHRFPTPDLASKKAALDNAKIPPRTDKGWTKSPDSTVNVDVKSKLQAANQAVDYMFFQVVVNVPKGTKIDKFQVSFDQVDDAARVSIFNNKNPNGKFYPDADVIGKANNLTVKSDFKNDVVEGENRVVITQYDWAPSGNNIKGIRILVNGSEVKPTPTPAKVTDIIEVELGREEQAQLDRMLKEKKAQTGDIQISLWWSTKNDLDLRVTDPKGETISFAKKISASGGKLDVDANDNSNISTTGGVENIFWPKGKAPKGKYKIQVWLWTKRDSSEKTPFKVQLILNGVRKTFAGAVKNEDDRVTVHEFEVK